MSDKKQTIKNLELFEKKMAEKKITKYKLVKLTGIKKSTLYAYFSGRIPMTPPLCATFADAIGVEIGEVFPQINEKGPELASVKDGTYNPEDLKNHVPQKSQEEIEKLEDSPAITVENMVAEAATLVPDDGFTLKSRMVVDHLGTEREALYVQPETQVVIKTGVKTLDVNLNKVIVHGIPKHMIDNECHVLPTPIDINGELCVVMYLHGKQLMVCRGLEIAHLMFI
jgi:hypothetical protein